MSKPKESSNKSFGKNRKWIHADDALLAGHVSYVAKFLGKTEASGAKGIEVVRESIQELKFTLPEGGKPPKVQIAISAERVAIHDLKAKKKKYEYPLHQISYCADDKADKKVFCFIAKEPNSDRHSSLVFSSDKQAEEIILTVGQAFELAFRRFKESSGKELENQRNIMILQKKVHDLEVENKKLREEISSSQKSKKNRNKDNLLVNCDVGIPTIQPPPSFHKHSTQKNVPQDLLGEFEEEPEPQPKAATETSGAYFEDIKELENEFNANYDKYEPIAQLSLENAAFGMDNFVSTDCDENDLLSAIGEVDRKLLEMKDGFQRGLSFGNDNFSSECSDTTETTSM